jgi:hypothetical protein
MELAQKRQIPQSNIIKFFSFKARHVLQFIRFSELTHHAAGNFSEYAFNLGRGMTQLSAEQTLLARGQGCAGIATFIYI